MEESNKRAATSFQKVRSGFGTDTFRAGAIEAQVPCEIWRDIIKNTDIRSINKLAQTCSKFKCLEHNEMALYHLGHMYWTFVMDPNNDMDFKTKAYEYFESRRVWQ
jgi:hypothetical protein